MLSSSNLSCMTIFSMNNAVLVRGTDNIFRRMVVLPEVTWNKEKKNKKEEEDKSHLHCSSIQEMYHCYSVFWAIKDNDT